MSTYIEYKARIQANVSDTDLEKRINDAIGHLGMFSSDLSTAKPNEFLLQIFGEGAYTRADEIFNALRGVFDAVDANGFYEVSFDSDPPVLEFIGQEGKQVRIAHLNQEISSKLIELHKLDGLTLPNVDGVAAPNFKFGDSVMEFVALRASQNYDPNTSALLALQDKARSVISTMANTIEAMMTGKVKPSHVPTVFFSEINTFNNAVDDVVKVSVAKNATRPRI